MTMEQNRDAAAEDLFDEYDTDSWEADGWEQDFDEGYDSLDDEEMFESFPPELMARSMTDALERLKDFDPFAV